MPKDCDILTGFDKQRNKKMAESIIEFQAGREAGIAGQKRDRRKSADWLEGWDMEEKQRQRFERHSGLYSGV